MSELSVGQLKGLAVNNNIISVPDGHRIKSIGGIVNVYTTRYTDRYVNASTSYVDLPSMSITLTPVSSTSKFFIMISTSRASTRIANLDFAAVLKLLRNGSDNVPINGTKIGNRDNAAMVFGGISYNGDHNPGGWTISGIDSPATSSQITYTVQTRAQNASYPLVMNGTYVNGDNGETYNAMGQTSMTIMEIAQ